MADEKKAFPLRLPAKLHAAAARLADSELRSVTGGSNSCCAKRCAGGA
jgi:hypothetical protein